MQLKSLIMLAVIAIASVGGAFFLVSKGYIRLGNPESELAVAETGKVEDIKNEKTEEPDHEIENEIVDEKIIDPEVGAAGPLTDLEVIPMDPIIVNLKGSSGRRYLKVTVNLGIKDVEVIEEDDKKKKDKGEITPLVKEVVEGKLVEIKDMLISLLSAKTIDDIDGWSDKDIIRLEIRDVLNKKLQFSVNKGISKVFFTEFVVQ